MAWICHLCAAAADPDVPQGGEGWEVKRHGCKVLMTKLGWLGEPHAANIPWWLLCSCNYRCYLGSCMVTFGQPGFSSSPASSSMLSFAGGMGEKGSLPPAKPSSQHSSLALVGGEGIKCPLSSPPPLPPALLWWEWEHPSFSLGGDGGLLPPLQASREPFCSLRGKDGC